MIPESSKTLMSPPWAGSLRTATDSGTPWISRPVTPTFTIWRPFSSLYWTPTCCAICSAPAVPPVVGAQFDQFRTPLSFVLLLGATMNSTTPASPARPSAKRAPAGTGSAACGRAAPTGRHGFARRPAGSGAARRARPRGRPRRRSPRRAGTSGSRTAGSSDAASTFGLVPAGSSGRSRGSGRSGVGSASVNSLGQMLSSRTSISGASSSAALEHLDDLVAVQLLRSTSVSAIRATCSRLWRDAGRAR